MRKAAPVVLASFLVIVPFAGCRSTPEAPTAARPAAVATPRPAPRAISRDLALETFDEAWSIVERTHFDPEYNGVDWQAVREDLRPRVNEVETISDLRRLVQEMVGRLGQSHFGVLPGDFVDALDADDDDGERASASATEVERRDRGRRPRRDPARPSDVGIDVRLVDGEVLITTVKPASPAAEAGLRTGWAVTRIGTRDITRLLDLAPDHLDERMKERYVWQSALAQLEGEDGSTVAITLVDEYDGQRVVELTRVPIAGERVKFGDLPAFYATVMHERIEVPESSRTVGYIALNVWMLPMSRRFDEAMDAVRDTEGIIIDLRGNPGGVGGMVMGIAGHFLDDRVALGTMVTRETDLSFVANPRRVSTTGRRVSPYAGPLAILVDGQTGSTSEMFAAGLQALGRARIFGERTMGAVLPAMTTPLPNGDVLLHAIANFVDPNGEPVEGRGVVPDVYAPHTREELLAGRDAAREAAIAWIISQADVVAARD